MRILGIDYGDRRVGLAISDPMGIIASVLPPVHVNGQEDLVKRIAAIIADNEVETAVIGLPKNMDGSEGERAEKCRGFGLKLGEQCSGLRIVFKDERLSSVSANRILDEAGMHWKKRKDVVDGIAAQIILQGYLEMNRS